MILHPGTQIHYSKDCSKHYCLRLHSIRNDPRAAYLEIISKMPCFAFITFLQMTTVDFHTANPSKYQISNFMMMYSASSMLSLLLLHHPIGFLISRIYRLIDSRSQVIFLLSLLAVFSNIDLSNQLPSDRSVCSTTASILVRSSTHGEPWIETKIFQIVYHPYNAQIADKWYLR